jgi:hypothetical protein
MPVTIEIIRADFGVAVVEDGGGGGSGGGGGG